ncbi:hypothetical protein GY45DRAFT_275187 [Cubamyces sp. BRFM 1775]|nr:hypothetical protein GY45DRAFT_275187 [Cubamyces sp. BRFM 1775]
MSLSHSSSPPTHSLVHSSPLRFRTFIPSSHLVFECMRHRLAVGLGPPDGLLSPSMLLLASALVVLPASFSSRYRITLYIATNTSIIESTSRPHTSAAHQQRQQQQHNDHLKNREYQQPAPPTPFLASRFAAHQEPAPALVPGSVRAGALAAARAPRLLHPRRRPSSMQHCMLYTLRLRCAHVRTHARTAPAANPRRGERKERRKEARTRRRGGERERGVDRIWVWRVFTARRERGSDFGLGLRQREALNEHVHRVRIQFGQAGDEQREKHGFGVRRFRAR